MPGAYYRLVHESNTQYVLHRQIHSNATPRAHYTLEHKTYDIVSILRFALNGY